jgi:hypothetical protein
VVVLGDDELRLVAFALPPVVLLVSKVSGLYDRDDLVLHKATLDEAPELFQLATLYALLISVLSGAFVSGGLGARQVVVLWATSSWPWWSVAGRRARPCGRWSRPSAVSASAIPRRSSGCSGRSSRAAARKPTWSA